MKLDKKSTLICDELKTGLNVNDLLSEIFIKMSIFNYYKGYVPEKILLSTNVYQKIKNEKPDVLISKNDSDYILTMKIILTDKKIFAKKLNFKEKKELSKYFPKLNKKENKNETI